MASRGPQLAFRQGPSLKIGVVCPYDLSAPGGVQQVAIDLSNHLRQGGDEVVLVGAGKYAHDRPGYDDTTVMTGRAFRIRANNSIVPLTLSPWTWGRVRDALAAVDVIHLHEPLIPLVGWVAMTVDRPLVVTFHADSPPWAERAYTWLPAGKFRRSVLTAVSPTAARAIPEDWGPVEVIPNGIDTASFRLPVGRVERRVCFLGRDEPRKGLDTLLDAWQRIRERVPQAELKVMGADRGEGMNGVAYVGRVTGGEKNRILASSQVYVAPNTGGESFGIVLIEAMAAGCAVVCSDLEAFRDVVGSHALLVPVGDPDRLAEAVVALLEDPTASRAMGESGRASVARFDWGVIGARYRDQYLRAIA
jgi:phosphatidyl-myo-inositol alpha-mannosyltransferase